MAKSCNISKNKNQMYIVYLQLLHIEKNQVCKLNRTHNHKSNEMQISNISISQQDFMKRNHCLQLKYGTNSSHVSSFGFTMPMSCNISYVTTPFSNHCMLAASPLLDCDITWPILDLTRHFYNQSICSFFISP